MQEPCRDGSLPPIHTSLTRTAPSVFRQPCEKDLHFTETKTSFSIIVTFGSWLALIYICLSLSIYPALGGFHSLGGVDAVQGGRSKWDPGEVRRRSMGWPCSSRAPGGQETAGVTWMIPGDWTKRVWWAIPAFPGSLPPGALGTTRHWVSG